MARDGIILGPRALSQIREVVLRVLKGPITQPRSQKRRHVSVTGAPIVFQNKSSETCPKGALMRISSEVLEEDRVVYRIGKPNSTFKRQYLINVGEDIEVDDYGAGSWLTDAGYFLAEGTPALGDSYGAKANQWAAVKNRNGFEVTGGKTGTGSEQRVCGRQSIVSSLLGKPAANISSGGTGTAKIWFRTTSGTREESEFDAINVSAWKAAVFGGGSAKACGITWDSGEWVITPYEC